MRVAAALAFASMLALPCPAAAGPHRPPPGTLALSTQESAAQDPATQDPATQDPVASTPAVQAAQDAETTPQRIPEGDIPARAEIVDAALRRIETLIQPSAELTRIDDALDDREVGIEALRGLLDAINPYTISTRRLEDMRIPWLELQRELAGWKATADSRFAAIQNEREFLRELRARWELTLEPTGDADLAPELLGRLQSVLARVIDVETRVRAQRDTVGIISERIAASQRAVSDALERIDGIRGLMRGRLLSRDASPLWRSLGSLQARPGYAVDAARDWAAGMIAYLRLRPGRGLFLVASFCLLLFGAVRLRRQHRESAPDDGDGEQVRRLLERPFSVSLAAALAITVLVPPYPTGSATDAVFLLAVVPVMRLGQVLLERRARNVLYAVVVLMLAARIAALGADGSAGTRLLLLLVTVLALAGAVRKARVGRREMPPRGWGRVVSTGAIVAATILGTSLAANVLGWVRLSKVLTEATLDGLFAAFAWAIIVAATATLLPVVIRLGLGNVLPSLRRKQEVVIRVMVTALSVVAVFVWVNGRLVAFQLRAPMMDALRRVADSGIEVGGLAIGTGQVLGGGLILALTWLVAHLVGFFAREEVVPRMRLRRGSAQSILSLTNYAIWGVGIALAASAAGLTGTQLAVVIGALGVGIGFGLQTIVNNFVSGLILIFERPIKVGDTVQTPNYWGKVERIGIRASVIRSFDGAEIIVPNGELVAKELTNWTGTDEIRRAEVLVGVEYGTPPERVLEILLRVAQEHSKALPYPEPQAQMIGFGDSSLDFRLRCWTPMDDWVGLVSDLHVAINRELEAAGITIPFPQRDLHVKSSADTATKEIEVALETAEPAE